MLERVPERETWSAREQSAPYPAPRGHETHFYPSPEAAFHFISWIDAEVIYSVSAKIWLKKIPLAFGNLGGNWRWGVGGGGGELPN